MLLGVKVQFIFINASDVEDVLYYKNIILQLFCLVLTKVDTFMNNKKCVKQCERVQQSTARSSN